MAATTTTTTPSLSSHLYAFPGATIKDMDISADGETIVVAGCRGTGAYPAFVRTIDLGAGRLGTGCQLAFTDATSVTRFDDVGAFAVGVHGHSLCVMGPGAQIQYKQWREEENIVRTDKLVANRSGTKLARVTVDSHFVDILTIDKESMTVIARLPLEHQHAIKAVAWSTVDDNVLVVGAGDVLTLHDLNPEGMSMVVWSGWGEASSIAYDPSSGGNTIAVGYENGFVRRWDLSSHPITPIDDPPRVIQETNYAYAAPDIGVQYSPCGTILATYYLARPGVGLIKLWNTALEEYSKEWSHVLRGHTGTITKVVFDPRPSTTRMLYSCSIDGTVREWDIPGVFPLRGGELTKAAGRRQSFV